MRVYRTQVKTSSVVVLRGSYREYGWKKKYKNL